LVDIMKFCVIAALLTLIACSPAGAPTVEPVEPVREEQAGLVRVGQISASHSLAGPPAVESLRGALLRAARALSEDPRVGRPLVLEGAISDLVHEREGAGLLTVRATVSLSLRDAAGGRILVVLEGSAQSRGAAPAGQEATHAVEGEVVAGAVDGLMDRLGPALDSL
jgi:hypothetical protein